MKGDNMPLYDLNTDQVKFLQNMVIKVLPQGSREEIKLKIDRNQSLKLVKSDVIKFYSIIDAPAEIMRLDKDGMVYKGKRIEDAGEAHRLFIEVMELTKLNYEEEKNGI